MTFTGLSDEMLDNLDHHAGWCSCGAQGLLPPTLTIPDDPEWLAQRLNVHRYCDTHPRGHQSCVDEAARLLAAMRGSA